MNCWSSAKNFGHESIQNTIRIKVLVDTEVHPNESPAFFLSFPTGECIMGAIFV